MTNPFEDKIIRSIWDGVNNKHWFSIIDICAVLRDCDYQCARNYWKWLKSRLQDKITYQIKLEAPDGKLRLTDVTDIDGIVRLIQLFPSKKADAFRLWISDTIINNKTLKTSITKDVCKLKNKTDYKVGEYLLTHIHHKTVSFN